MMKNLVDGLLILDTIARYNLKQRSMTYHVAHSIYFPVSNYCINTRERQQRPQQTARQLITDPQMAIMASTTLRMASSASIAICFTFKITVTG